MEPRSEGVDAMAINRLIPPMLGAFALAFAQVAIEPRTKASERIRPNLRVDSNLVLVPVSVVDQRDHPVTGLEQGNFRVFDDGVERTITTFAMEDEPVALGLVFDHSGSVANIRRNEAETTRLFLKTSNPEDEYLLVTFASRPELAVPLTEGKEDVQYRILTTKWGGTTALYDGVILGLSGLKTSKLRRKALLVVSDGGENNSRYNRRELERIVEESDVLIYTIGFASNQADFALLKWMAELSGGRAIAAHAEGMPDIAAKVALELRNRYVLGFSAAGIQRDGKVHSLRVELVTPHGMPPLQASWRRSYYAPEN
jgi:Ca-activated chloride channel family protein